MADDLLVTRERLERWARNPHGTLFGMEQDEDLVLAHPENVPLMCEFLDRRDVPMPKRTLIVSAMAEMLLLERSEEFVTDAIAAVLEAALLRNVDAVRAAYEDLGVPAEVRLRRLLGDPVPEEWLAWLAPRAPLPPRPPRPKPAPVFALRYIERKSGHDNDGPAWIGRVRLSRSGQTVYFDGKAFEKSRPFAFGSYYDVETGERYWISAVKKDGSDRRLAGSGTITIEAAVVEEYLRKIGARELDPSRFVVSDRIAPADPSKRRGSEDEPR